MEFTSMTAYLALGAGLAVKRLSPRSGGKPPRTSFFYLRRRKRTVAKTSPGELIRQVRSETAKVVWPTRQETVRTAVMVVIMTALLALFFFGVDYVFSSIVRFLLSLIA
jgi:preprotein translocase subunit SecE